MTELHTEQRIETKRGTSSVILRFTGKPIASDGDTTVWLIEDGRVLLEDAESYETFDDAQTLADWTYDSTRNNLGAVVETLLGEAVEELGIAPVIDL